MENNRRKILLETRVTLQHVIDRSFADGKTIIYGRLKNRKPVKSVFTSETNLKPLSRLLAPTRVYIHI